MTGECKYLIVGHKKTKLVAVKGSLTSHNIAFLGHHLGKIEENIEYHYTKWHNIGEINII